MKFLKKRKKEKKRGFKSYITTLWKKAPETMPRNTSVELNNIFFLFTYFISIIIIIYFIYFFFFFWLHILVKLGLSMTNVLS